MSKPEKIIFIFFIGFSLQISLAQANEIEKNISIIPAGEFLMGTDEGTEIERPIHNVYLDEFRINRFEVSNIKFEKFQPNHTRSVRSSCDQCPVTIVDWYSASSYCKSQNGRLPSEAEWEKAARGPNGHKYSFNGNPEQSKSNFAHQFQDGAKTVNSFKPNGFGLYNMSGNVWEWVNDWFMLYTKPKHEILKKVRTYNEKVLRGGSWYNPAYYINVGMRFKIRPNIKLNSIGFRCAWDAQ